MAAFVDIEEKDIKKIANLFKDAVPVTEDLLEKMKKQLEGINANKTKEENRWDDSIRSLFNPQIETLFSYELPESFELKKGEYFAFLDEEYDGNKENLKNIFRWSNSYLWLLGTLQKNKGCMYFGELSSCLHNSVVSDPKPYRREIKVMLANLLQLIEKLEMDEIVIDQRYHEIRRSFRSREPADRDFQKRKKHGLGRCAEFPESNRTWHRCATVCEKE